MNSELLPATRCVRVLVIMALAAAVVLVVGVGVGAGAEWDVYRGAGTPIQDAVDGAGGMRFMFMRGRKAFIGAGCV